MRVLVLRGLAPHTAFVGYVPPLNRMAASSASSANIAVGQKVAGVLLKKFIRDAGSAAALADMTVNSRFPPRVEITADRVRISLTDGVRVFSAKVAHSEPPGSIDLARVLDGICYALLAREPSPARLRSFFAQNQAAAALFPCFRQFRLERGVLLTLHPTWYRAAAAFGRADMNALMQHALDNFFGMTLRMDSHYVLTNMLTETTGVDVTCWAGAYVAHMMWNACILSDSGALAASNRTSTQCGDRAAVYSTATYGDGTPMRCVYFRTDACWHLFVMRDYDLLFIWLALLFDVAHGHMWTRMPLSLLGDSDETSPVPTLRRILLWRDEHSQH